MSTKSKKILRYSLYGLGGTLLFIVLAALILPYLFKDKILATAKHYINQQLNATVEIEDVDLSLLWTFPEFSFKLKGLSVTGKEEFEGLKLAEMKHFGLYLNLWSVISGDYTVTGVELQEPKLYIKVLNNGKANYDIVKPSTDTTSTAETPAEEGAGDFRVKLRYYALNEADVVYDDAPAGLFLQIKNLSHKGSADFTASNFDLFTRTTIEALSFKQGGIPYLSKAELEAKLDVRADIQAMRFKLLDNNFRINDVRLALEGEVAMPGEDIDMDLKFSSPSTAFASVLSLVPGAYTKDFAGLKAGGSFAFSAFAKGIYNAKSLPAFGLNLQVKDGNFQYPSLPMGVKDVQMDLQVNSPSSNLDAMAIDLKQFKMLLGANAFEANMALRSPLSDPDIRAELKGKIDLADLAKAFPMEEVQELNGLIETDLSAKTKLSYVEQELYDQVQMRGLFRLTGFNYLSKGLPKVSIKEFKTEFTPNFVQVDNFDLTVGKSDFQIQGKLDNILTYFSRDKVMEGFLQVESKLLDANELMAASGSGESSSAQPTAVDVVDTSRAASAEVEVFDRFRFAANIKMNKVLYDTYDVRDIVAEGSFTPEMAKLQKLSLLIGKTDMLAEGQLENVFAYLFGKGVLRGYLNFSSNYFNLNQLMGESGQATEPAPQPAPADPSTASSAIEAFEVPANLDLVFNANIKRLIYETYKLDNARAEVLIKDQKVKIVDLRCDALGGFIALNGEYDAKDLSKPKFSFGYDIQKIDFQEAHKSVALVQYFLPVMKSIQGRFDSKFKIQGLLDKNLYPVLSSITAEGAIITSEAILKGFSALTNLSKEVGVKDLDELTLKGTKNFFSIKDGRVELQPFVYEFKGIDLNFGGSHGLDNTSDYKLKMRVPKASLTANPVGAAAGAAAQTGLNKLQGQASKLGVNLNLPEVQFVNLGVDITGSLLKPQFKVNFLGAETKDGKGVGDQVGASLREEADKLKAEAEAKAREMEEKARAEADKLKAEAEAKARAEADKLRSEGEKAKAEAEAKARAEAERLRKEAEAKAKAEADRLRQSQAAQAAQAAKDSVARAAQQRIKLPNNPLKKDK